MPEKSVWIINSDKNGSSQPIIDYITKQGTILGEETCGKIKGVLLPAEYSLRNLAIDGADAFIRSFSTKGFQNASDLYANKLYEFFIIDEIHRYELSVFQIKYNAILPVTLTIDRTIANEANLKETQRIHSLETFKSVFEKIVTTNKVVYIIERLLNMPLPEEEIDESSKSTSADSREETQQ